MDDLKAPRDPPKSDSDSDETTEVPTEVMQQTTTEENPSSVTEQAEKITASEHATTSEPEEQAVPEKDSDHRARNEKESDDRALHEKESTLDDRTLYKTPTTSESQARMVLQDYLRQSLQEQRFTQQDICVQEFLPGKEEHPLHEYSLPGDWRHRMQNRQLSGKERQRELEADMSRQIYEGLRERYLDHRNDQETGSENDPDNLMRRVESTVSDPDRGYPEVLAASSDPLGIPHHWPGTEARSLLDGSSQHGDTGDNRTGDNMSCVRTTPSESADDRYPVINRPRGFSGETADPGADTDVGVSTPGSISLYDDGNQHDFEDDSENPRLRGTDISGEKKEITTEVATGTEIRFRIPDNTVALGRNLETNSLLTMSPTLLLGEYHEDIVSSRQFNEDTFTQSQHPSAGDFPMLRFESTRTGQVVVATDTRIRVLSQGEELHVENLHDQIQDIAVADTFVYALLSTSIQIYTMHQSGSLEHHRTVALRASSGRLALHGDYIYITREQQRMIKRLSIRTFEVTTFLRDLQRPSAIAVDMNGRRIFFADDHYVRIVDARGNALGHIHVGTPVDDLVELNGIVYVLTPGGLRQYKYNADTQSWTLQ